MLLFLSVLILSSTAFAQSIPQPGIITYDPGIANFRPAFWGEMVEIRGNNFANGETYDNHINVFAKAFLVDNSEDRTSNFPLVTHVASSELIYFLVPVEAPCGEQRFYIKNGADLPDSEAEISATRFVFIECAASELGPQAARPELTSIEPRLPRAGDEITLRGSGFTFSNEVKWNNVVLEDVTWISEHQMRIRVPNNAICGRSHSLRFQNVIQHYPAENSSFPSPSQPIFLSLNCAAIVAPTERSLFDIDLDRNCRIDDFEFFNTVDAWVVSEVTDTLFFRIVDAWVEDSDVCTVSSARLDRNRLIHNEQNKRANLITNETFARVSMARNLSIYDMSGRELLKTTWTQSQLLGISQSRQLRHLANGVYFVRDHSTNETLKFIVLR
jgi:hypothetical protein